MNPLHMLFPAHCPYCGRVISYTQPACESCCRLYPPNSVDMKFRHSECIAPFPYNGQFRKAMLNFKFYGKPQYSKQLSMNMAALIKDKYSDKGFCYVTCVPITKKAFNKRGYNQAELLAKQISSITHIQYKPLILKTKNNKTQHTLCPSQRKENVKGVYEINSKYKSKIQGRTILLIDDIATTGYTLSECVEVLLTSGAKAVFCATYAIAKRYNPQ